MEEITQMCDRVIFLNAGGVVASDTPLNLTKMVKDSLSCFCCFLPTFGSPSVSAKSRLVSTDRPYL